MTFGQFHNAREQFDIACRLLDQQDGVVECQTRLDKRGRVIQSSVFWVLVESSYMESRTWE